MAVSLKHSKTSAQADGGNTALVQPSDWNAEHVLSQGTGKLLGRTTAGDGPTEEISVGSGLSFSAGSISVNFSGYAPLASPTFTGTATFADASVGGNVGVGTNAPASKLDVNGGMATNVVAVAASAIDCSAGTVFTKTASGALTWTFTNVPASRAFTVILELTNGGTGTQTWPASVKWPAGTAPTLTTAGVDVFAFFTDDGGTTWRGVLLMKDSK